MKLKANWKIFRIFFNRLKLRERQLIILSSSIVTLAMFTMAIWEPMYAQWIKSSSDLEATKQQVVASLSDIEIIKMTSKLDANKPYREKLIKYRKNIDEQQKKIGAITAALINPKNMSTVFGTLLQNSELEINKINNEKAEAVDIKGKEPSEELLYKHGLSLEMVGTFMGSKQYLERIERQDWNLYWNELTFKTTNYPKGILTLNVHTLSTSDHVFGL